MISAITLCRREVSYRETSYTFFVFAKLTPKGVSTFFSQTCSSYDKKVSIPGLSKNYPDNNPNLFIAVNLFPCSILRPYTAVIQDNMYLC